jgi:hypothetical protein
MIPSRPPQKVLWALQTTARELRVIALLLHLFLLLVLALLAQEERTATAFLQS